MNEVVFSHSWGGKSEKERAGTYCKRSGGGFLLSFLENVTSNEGVSISSRHGQGKSGRREEFQLGVVK